ncbi:MAG: hypothetical protein HXS46_06710 [Theionarchaea archaeon]|nr:hypothetical protein [Theionarchaea archaeon]
MKNPFSVHSELEEYPSIITVNIAFGKWNLFFIADEWVDCSKVGGYQECVLQGVKGVTFLSRVITLDREESTEKCMPC